MKLDFMGTDPSEIEYNHYLFSMGAEYFDFVK